MVRVGRKRPLWVGIVVVVVFFACVTLAVAWLGGGPDVPHAVGRDQATCTTCHPVAQLPEDHRDRVDVGCGSCHSVSPSQR